ncbi:hypothetical protein HG531_004970 [Fusarium graminearum]|nr:hypothetical protein HG531_004970 [Fusarium graminearum]
MLENVNEAQKINVTGSVLGSLLGPDVVAKGVLHVDKTGVSPLGNALDSLKVLVGQAGNLEVALNARGSGALGQNSVAAAETPGDEDLSKGVAATVGDLVKGLVGADGLTSGGDLVLGTEGRVSSGENVVLEAELDEILVGQERMNLDLVNGGLDLCEGHELLQAVDSPVGDTNGTGLATSINLLHGAPCGLGVLSEILLDDVLAIRADLGLVVVALLGSDRPVDEEEVNVVKAEVVPDLCANEEILALDAVVLGEEITDGLANLALVQVEPSAVEVSVAGLEGGNDSLVGLALGALVSKGAKAHTGHLDTIVEGKDSLVGNGHFDGA